MHKKITKTLLLITLLVLLIGITSAATVSDNTTTTKVTKDKNIALHPEVQKSNEKIVEKKENKEIINREKNKKTAIYSTLFQIIVNY